MKSIFDLFRKREPLFGRQEITLTIATFSIRETHHLSDDAFAGIMASELAKQIVRMTIIRMNSLDDRLAAGLMGMIFTSYFCQITAADYYKASYYMVEDLLVNRDNEESETLLRMYSKLAIAQAPIIGIFRQPFREWMEQPILVNLLIVAESFKFLHATITGEPELPL